MTPSAEHTIDQPTWHAPSPAARAAAALAGIVVVLAIVAVTLGTALAAFVGMAIAAWWRRRRARPDTRTVRWMDAVVGTSLVTVAVMMFSMLRLHSRVDAMNPAQREALQRRVDALPPSAVDRMLPNAAASRQVASARAQKPSRSRLFVWSSAMSSTLVGAFVGLVVGSVAWGGATLALFGFTGRWQPRAMLVADPPHPSPA